MTPAIGPIIRSRPRWGIDLALGVVSAEGAPSTPFRYELEASAAAPSLLLATRGVRLTAEPNVAGRLPHG